MILLSLSSFAGYNYGGDDPKRKENTDAREFKDVKVYAADLWNNGGGMKGFIKDLKIEMK